MRHAHHSRPASTRTRAGLADVRQNELTQLRRRRTPHKYRPGIPGKSDRLCQDRPIPTLDDQATEALHATTASGTTQHENRNTQQIVSASAATKTSHPRRQRNTSTEPPRSPQRMSPTSAQPTHLERRTTSRITQDTNHQHLVPHQQRYATGSSKRHGPKYQPPRPGPRPGPRRSPQRDGERTSTRTSTRTGY